METLTGTVAALPLHLLTNLHRKSRWTATLWTGVAVVAVAFAMGLRPKASVQLPVDCSRKFDGEETEKNKTDMLTE